MTTSTYSLDLRKKVINYIKSGHSQSEESILFQLHKNTINWWWIRYQSEGHCNARPRLGYKSKVNKSDLEQFVITNPNSKLKIIGNKFNISGWHAGRILKQLGFSYKKSLHLCGSERRQKK